MKNEMHSADAARRTEFGMRPRFTGRLAIILGLSAATFASAQTTPISISNATVYSQNFDTMGTGLTPSYPTGWNGFKFSGGGSIPLGQFVNPETSDGQNNNGTIYNAGSIGSTDRALGSLASGQITGGFGAVFRNDSGVTITENFLTISFRAEQWRRGSSPNFEQWMFEYRVVSVGNDINQTSSTGWTRVNALDMFEISNVGPTSNLNGNAVGNFQNIAPSTLAGLSWGAGDLLIIRWLDTDDGASDSLMAIDDLSLTYSLTPVPEPATLELFAGLALSGAFITRLRRPRRQIA
ncbi:MAG TPA: hypothetical protein VNC50_17985 [Planctomycetia bacterium]|nr:hypothetical protein [Planctomycetia bacterium]